MAAQEYEVQISLAQAETGEFGMAVFIAPFKTKEEADAYARRIAGFLESEANARIERVQ